MLPGERVQDVPVRLAMGPVRRCGVRHIGILVERVADGALSGEHLAIPLDKVEDVVQALLMKVGEVRRLTDSQWALVPESHDKFGSF